MTPAGRVFLGHRSAKGEGGRLGQGSGGLAIARSAKAVRPGGTAAILSVAVIIAACGRAERSAPAATESAAAPSPTATTAANTAVYMCPMDRDIRGYAPGKCPRCGMALVTSIPDPVEYRVDVTAEGVPEPGKPVQLRFGITDPWKGNPVTKFMEVHEKLYHAFVVSRDLQFFLHGHPQLKDGRFEYDVTFPKPGMYRVLSDFYPEASVPQLSASTIFVGRVEPDPRPVVLARDYKPKQGENIGLRMDSIPQTAIAGMPTRLRFALDPVAGIEKYLGVWAHMLIASDDLIDLMHTHPSIANGGSEMEFSVVFPRAHTYRIWVQVQRKGMVNTVHFDVPVKAMPAEPASPKPQAKAESEGPKVRWSEGPWIVHEERRCPALL